MRILAPDFETYPIGPALQLPPPVCMSWALATDTPDPWAAPGEPLRGLEVDAASVVTASEGIDLLTRTLEDGETLIVGANTAFEILVSILWSPEPERLAGLWAWAVDNQRVTDVLLRQALIDRATGSYHRAYNLGAVCARTCGRILDKASEWRTLFGTLDGLPIAAYPEPAYRYSLEDALGTIETFLFQEQVRRAGSPYFPGYDMLADQYRQQAGAIPLKDMSAYGLRANPVIVERFRRHNDAARDALRRDLEGAGLVYREYTRDYGAIAARAESLGKPLPRTAGGKPSLARRGLVETQDATLCSLLDWPQSAAYLSAMGLATYEWHKDTAKARAMAEQALGAKGIPVPKTELKPPKKGETSEQYAKRAAKFEPKTKLDNDTCERAAVAAEGTSGELLRKYAELSSLDTVLGSPSDQAAVAAREPLHAHYKPLQATGRTATGAGDEGEGGEGNVQNMHRKPGVREQYCPRQSAVHPELACVLTEDHVYIDADFTAVELHTFAQICHWVVGWSALGDKLTANPPIDPHLEIAADIAGVTYDEAKRRLKAKDARIADERTGGKGINFGRKGAMGAAKFVKYAWNNYRIKLGETQEEALRAAQRLIDIHDARTPEFPLYSKWVQSHARTPGKRDSKFDLVHPYSGRLVANLGFSDAHNYPFQGLAADVAKRALWLVWKAKWGLLELGTNDPLYRCGLVLFAHDSITVEVLRSLRTVAAARLNALMRRAAAEICPQVPAGAPAGAQMQLSKKAEPLCDAEGNVIYDAQGQILVWDAWEQALQSARKIKAAGGNVVEGLTKQLWPAYIVEDAAAIAA